MIHLCVRLNEAGDRICDTCVRESNAHKQPAKQINRQSANTDSLWGCVIFAVEFNEWTHSRNTVNAWTGHLIFTCGWIIVNVCFDSEWQFLPMHTRNRNEMKWKKRPMNETRVLLFVAEIILKETWTFLVFFSLPLDQK